MTFARSILGLTLVCTTSGMAQKEAAPTKMPLVSDVHTFYLINAQPPDGNEIITALRSMLPPDTHMFLTLSQNALTVGGTPEEIALAQKIISDLDRPKKAYRLTYTLTESDGGKKIGVQHLSVIAVAGARTTLKNGSKVPVATGSYGASTGSTSPGVQTQFTYLDIGMNIDASLDQMENGVRLKSKVEQSSVAELPSGAGPADPIVRQSVLEGVALLTPGKPELLGTLDITGSTRHLEIEVVMEPVK
jgi:type II secretory pathway component GspD/PulD (secretin)